MKTSLDLSTYSTSIRIGADMRVDLFTPTMFRVRISQLPGDPFPPAYEIPFAVGKLANWAPVAHVHRREGGLDLLETEALQIRIEAATRQWTVWTRDGGRRICPSDGPVYGIFRDGYTLFDSASAFEEPTQKSRFSHFFYSPETGRYVDVHLKEDVLLDRYFIYGPDYPRLFAQFNELVGPEPLLPKKAFGFMQTQHLANQGNQDAFMRMAEKMRDRQIPCDILILDFEWGDGCDGAESYPWGSRQDWARAYSQPLTPAQMVARLKELHYDLMLIHHSVPAFPNRPAQGWTSVEVDEDAWWRKLEEKLAIGVAGTWQDTRGNDVTNSAVAFGLRQIQPGRRPLLLACRDMQGTTCWNRASVPIPVESSIGARRYPAQWTGDCDFTWRELKWQIQAIANSQGAMHGITYLTSDSVGRNWKIQARWNQFTDFTTVSRAHSPKPWTDGDMDHAAWHRTFAASFAWGQTPEKQPPETAADFAESPIDWSHSAEAGIRKHRRLRYRLLPYIYSHAHINYRTGIPVCRPMLLAFAGDPACNRNQWPCQYMFGESLLVAPVYGDFKTMDIYLPAGEQWIDYWERKVYAGGRVLSYDTADVERLPLFVRAGAILPMRPDAEWIDPAAVDDPLTLDLYPGGRSEFVLYEDDGVTEDYQRGDFARTPIRCDRTDRRGSGLRIEAVRGRYAGQPTSRRWIVRLPLVPERPAGVAWNGRPMTESGSGDGWHHDRTTACLEIRIAKPESEAAELVVT